MQLQPAAVHVSWTRQWTQFMLGVWELEATQICCSGEVGQADLNVHSFIHTKACDTRRIPSHLQILPPPLRLPAGAHNNDSSPVLC